MAPGLWGEGTTGYARVSPGGHIGGGGRPLSVGGGGGYGSAGGPGGQHPTRAVSAEGVGGYANGANGASWPYANGANLSQMPRRRGGGV